MPILLFVLIFVHAHDVFLVCAGAIALMPLFLLQHKRGDAIYNTASLIARRPIALTARGRGQIELEALPPEVRRQERVRFLGFLATVFLLAAAGVVLGLAGN